MERLGYRPWQPREGMTGMYWHLVAAWGNPNEAFNEWPRNILERVCERGASLPVVFDPDAPAIVRWWVPERN